MRRTKIICTLGPAVEEKIPELIDAGMDTARFNFSHGTYETHGALLEKLKEARKNAGKYVAALLDTKGPEVRLGLFKNEKVDLHSGDTFTLTSKDVMGDENIVSVLYKEFPADLKIGDRVLIDDGLVELHVKKLTDTDIICDVINDGTISNNKGVNVPDTVLSMPYISEKDRDDILFAVTKGFDYIAASFVRTADDVKQVKWLLQENGGSGIKVIAKIENAQGIANIDEIISAADGIMVARGDMGVEIPIEDVPVMQKMIIKKTNLAGKVVITATQMLDSMIKNPRPTRAEATDVANAIYDGTCAIMLSGETANGKYPVEALKTMVSIAVRAEKDINYRKRFLNDAVKTANNVITESITHSACLTAMDLDASAIIGVSITGQSVRNVSKYKPDCQIIGCSTCEMVCRQMNLFWGVTPIMLKEQMDLFELFESATDESKKHGMVKDGDIVVLTAGIPLKKAGSTNMIHVHKVGETFN